MREIVKLKVILQLFSNATWMVINVNKSIIWFMDMDLQATNWIHSQFDYETVDIHNGIKYLGFIIKPNEYHRRD